jgi:hypothetical protein
MTLRLTGALLCGGLLAIMATATVAAKERKPIKGTDITRRVNWAEADKNHGRKTRVQPGTEQIFDRWGNISTRMGRNPATGEKPKPQYDYFLK